MSKTPTYKLFPALILALLAAVACHAPHESTPVVHLNYVGSSTVALFVAEAGERLDGYNFTLDTGPESDGGERAMLAGTADLAGLAREPSPEVKSKGIAAAMIGRDSLAVIVPKDLGVDGLSREELRLIYSGKKTNWSTFGGPDLEIAPFLVGPNSATRAVFREQVMGESDYAGSTIIEPDSAIVAAVGNNPGSIGFISFAFLDSKGTAVRAIAIDGYAPSLFDFEYPIARPLYLLWRPGTPGVDPFIQWATGTEGQAVVLHHYPGIGVLGSVDAQETSGALGTLVVYTDTFEVQDGDIEYFPHRPYHVLTEQGAKLRRIPNHRGVNDEHPTHVHLAAGVYLIRTETARGETKEFFATVRAGRTTVLRAEENR